MSRIAIAGNNSGSADVQIQAPAVNIPRQYDLPKHGGKVSVQGAPAAKPLTGLAVDFYSGVGDVVIPDDARRITIVLKDASTTGTDNILVQLGVSGSFVTTGYTGSASNQLGGVTATFSAGFAVVVATAAANVYHGLITLVRISGNEWVEQSQVAASNVAQVLEGAGSVSLPAALDRIRITLSGANNFDAGTVAILVE